MQGLRFVAPPPLKFLKIQMIQMKVIGICGTVGSGKEMVKQVLSKKFDNYYVTLSDAIKGVLQKRKKSFTRKDLQDIGDQMRQQYGTHVLAKVCTEFLQRDRSIIIVDGIRNPGEVDYLKKTYKDNFRLIGVDAPVETRFQWVQKRAKPEDPKTLEEFKEIDERDKGNGQPPYGQQVAACLGMADFKIQNDGSQEDFIKKIEEVASQL